MDNIHTKYLTLIKSLQNGFDAGICRIDKTFTPPNSTSLDQYLEAYQQIVDKEISSGRYIGPLLCDEVQSLISPFQSSALFLIPKPGKAAKFHAVHNFSHPHTLSNQIYSINYTINSDLYPCTWGTFGMICYTIHNLPPGSQAYIRDVAEAYHMIPISQEQWPGLIIKM